MPQYTSMASHIMKMKRFSAVLLSAALLVGCGEETIDSDACEHIQEGPASAITASASFAVAEANDYTLFLDAEVPVNLKDANGQRIEVVASGTGSSECSEIKRRHTFTLAVGTYSITFGPSTEGSVSLVIVGADHDREHEG